MVGLPLLMALISTWPEIQGRFIFDIQWPLVTPNPGFKVTVFFEGEYLKNGVRDKVSIEH